MDFIETYSRMSDDQLLNIARESEQLRPEALEALKSEMRSRRVKPDHVEEYRQHIQSAEPPSEPALTTASRRGIGTALYGKRDFKADGSYLTTKWIVAFWIPIIPLCSYRVRERSTGSGLWAPSVHKVLEKGRPNPKQVCFIYGYLLLLLLLPLPRGAGDATDIIRAVALVAAAVLPFILRSLARQRVSAEVR